MALVFYTSKDIAQMDADNIPEEFVNYFETLDDDRKAALLGTRKDLAEALGFVLPEINDEDASEDDSTDTEADNTMAGDTEADVTEETEEGDLEEEIGEAEEEGDELAQIRNNRYEGQDLSRIITNNMPEIEALTVADGAETCLLHRTPLQKRQINYGSKGKVYGIVLYICPMCNRIFIQEHSLESHHKALMERNIPHTFYSLELTNQFLRSQMPPQEFSSDDKLYIPDTWVEERPLCPIHETEVYEVSCVKKYKNRQVSFTGYCCDKCGKIMVRRAAARDLEDECLNAGIAPIECLPLRKKAPEKKIIKPKNVVSDFVIENGKRSEYRYNINTNCYQLTEEDTVIVSDSIYCALERHYTQEVPALIWVHQKRGGRKAYLFRLGYCADCQKYYMDIDDYKVLYFYGRPEVMIIRDVDDADYQITSGEVFNLERQHLADVEAGIDGEIDSIKEQPDYVNPYAPGDFYDDGNLAWAKHQSKLKYGERLDELESYTNKPYSYRVDISLDGESETYYVGAADITLNGKKQVISANSDFGHELIHYQTIKVNKDGREYDIKLSRQFDIENAVLYGYANLRTDEDIIFKSGITDPFLVRVLNMRKRQHNLTDIFVTIQENQNRIVNADFEKNIIVQGCAGSGKTMVLLHRLSSLNYRQKEFDFSRDAFILTPNDQFTLHIKGLAEELQIGSIPRASVEQYYIDTLLLYSPEFKLDGTVSTEMIVRQSFVDYVYSDQFLKDFESAYDAIISDRNALSETLDDLTKAMGQPNRKIDFSDDTKVFQQLQLGVSAMQGLVNQSETEIESAVNECKRLVERKLYLVKHVASLSQTSEVIVSESLPRAYTKIAAFLSESRQSIASLEEQIQELNAERERVQGAFILFGKRARLEDLDKKIKAAQAKLDTQRKTLDEQLPVLSQSTGGANPDDILVWLRQVMLIVPEVVEEVRLCTNFKEEYKNLSAELSGIDALIEAARQKEEEKKGNRYSDEIKRAIEYLSTELDKYSLINTYELVFDKAVAAFKKEHNIKAIRGKYHRYDLYARLLFAKRFFKRSVGTVRFMCIDEGQDLALNEYHLLYELNQRDIVFNIFGDTNQLMKSGRGISDWSEVEKAFHAVSFTLNENYRNTNQITRFCNSSFDMNVLQTGVDGANVREISRRDLEKELAALNVGNERIAILVPRGVQKNKYIDTEILPETIVNIIGDKMENGHIALMYVDEVKGIEFDRAFVVGNKMSRNEKYIAYTRALSELIIVVDDKVAAYDDGSLQEADRKKSQKTVRDKNAKKKAGVLNYSATSKKEKLPDGARVGKVAAEKAAAEKMGKDKV